MEFFRRCLIKIFGILVEYEVGAEGQRTLLGPLPDPPKEKEEEEEVKETPSDGQTAEAQKTPKTEEGTLPAAADIEKAEAVVKKEVQVEPRPKQASKFDKLPILVEEEGEEWEELERRWAELSQPNGFISGLLHWKAGGGDSTAHIQTGDTITAEKGRGDEGGGEVDEERAKETTPETQKGKNLEEEFS